MSHLLTTRNPMSEARRQHVYGKLQSLSVEANDIGEPSLFAGFLIIASGLAGLLAIAAGFAVITGAFALRAEPASGLVADAHQSPIEGKR